MQLPVGSELSSLTRRFTFVANISGNAGGSNNEGSSVHRYLSRLVRFLATHLFRVA